MTLLWPKAISLQHFSSNSHVWFFVTCCKWICFSRGIELDDPQECLAYLATLWFRDLYENHVIKVKVDATASCWQDQQSPTRKRLGEMTVHVESKHPMSPLILMILQNMVLHGIESQNYRMYGAGRDPWSSYCAASLQWAGTALTKSRLTLYVCRDGTSILPLEGVGQKLNPSRKIHSVVIANHSS